MWIYCFCYLFILSTLDLSEIRISDTLKLTDPDLIQMDEFKNEQLLSLTINLLLFIRSQVPVTKKLFQSCEFTQKRQVD